MTSRTGNFRGAHTNFGCGCDGPPRPSGLGGLFSTALDVAGSFVGDPGLGDQIASKAGRAFAPVTQTPTQIAKQVTPGVKAALESGSIDSAGITPASQQIASSIGPAVAASLAAEGVYFPPGTKGAELQRPTPLDAFGGANAKWVLFGGLALGAALLFKGF